MAKELSLAIVGADYPNKRGPSRRFEIAMCRPGETIDLRPEPKNPKDPRAVAVFSARGIQIGYVRAERAQFVRMELERGPVTAIFQRPEAWGATVRVGLRGNEPTLPHAHNAEASDWPPPGSEDADWWPDEEWPD